MATIRERLQAQKLGLKSYPTVSPDELLALADQAEKAHRVARLFRRRKRLATTGLPGGGLVDGRVVEARLEAEAILDSYAARYGDGEQPEL